MIQLPNDYKEDEDVAVSYKDMILQELSGLGIKPNEIAVWLSGDKEIEKLSHITENNNEINYLLFKVAPATGWDCPRASILVMYREIQSLTFRTLPNFGSYKKNAFWSSFFLILVNLTKDTYIQTTIKNL